MTKVLHSFFAVIFTLLSIIAISHSGISIGVPSGILVLMSILLWILVFMKE